MRIGSLTQKCSCNWKFCLHCKKQNLSTSTEEIPCERPGRYTRRAPDVSSGEYGSPPASALLESDGHCVQSYPVARRLLQEAWKGAGSTKDQASYRSLFISSNVGKCFHRVLRQKTIGLVEKAMHSLHCGVPVTVLALVAQMGQPACFMFLDTLSLLQDCPGVGDWHSHH